MRRPRPARAITLTLTALLTLAVVLLTAGCSGSAPPPPPTATPAPSTATPAPSTATPAPSTATPAPSTPTATPAPPTATPAPPTARPAPPTATPAPPATPTPSANLTGGCIDDFSPSVDYFPQKSSPEFAGNFTIEYHKSYKLLTVKEPFTGGSPRSYLLAQCGAPVPQLEGRWANAPVIRIPVETIFTGSTTHLPMLAALGRVDSLTGVAQTGYVSSQPVLDRIAAGLVAEFAPTFEIDAEVVIEASPGVLLASDAGPSQAHDTLANAGIGVVWNGEWLEETPLGRAEWLKMVAALFNEEAKANEQFENIAGSYNALAQKTGGIPEAQRPTVMTGLEFGGVFYASGGRSFAAQLIDHAGGSYVWADDDGSGSIETDIETQLERAGDADFWINAGAFWHTLSDVAGADERYTHFKPYKTGQIWTNNLALNDAGANDYYERGVTRPDLVLADLISIFHPSLTEERELQFYKQLQAP